MKLLLARDVAGRFSRVLLASFRKDGTGPLAAKWGGSIESLAVRQAGRFFAAEPAAVDVFYSFGSQSFRVTRVD